MKYSILLILLIIFNSCGTIDSEKVLKSILKIENLSDYKYKILFVKDKYSGFPYTIYYKINIDSLYYEQIKNNEIIDCREMLLNQHPFESDLVKYDNYDTFKKENIPDWFYISTIESDIWAFFDIGSLKFNNCDEYFDSHVFIKYYNGNCYLILDSIEPAWQEPF